MMRLPRRVGDGSGHALMELIVAIPILAVGGAAVVGMAVTSGGLLLESERRLEAAVRGVQLLDSLVVEARDRPGEGTFEVRGRTVEWAWNGAGRLELREGVGPARELGEEAVPGRGRSWILESRPDPGGGDG
jgi:hypothetical protein